jgi:hypothetical protein
MIGQSKMNERLHDMNTYGIKRTKNTSNFPQNNTQKTKLNELL